MPPFVHALLVKSAFLDYIGVTGITKVTKMTAIKKKFSVSVDEDVYNALARFVEVTGSSRSGFINDVLRESLPQLNRLTDIVELSKSNPDMAKKLVDELQSDFVSQLKFEEK